ncbi:nucleotidyltransferase domain-containing protein, partial [Kibdelosporangium lantanae]
MAFADRLRGSAEALLVGGSLATGDYRPGISDMDLVAITDDPGDIRQRHRKGSKLHCVYVPRARLDDVHQNHPTWTTGMLIQRPLSRIARAELHRHGFSV